LLVAGPGTSAAVALNADERCAGDTADVDRPGTGPDRDLSTMIVSGTAITVIRTIAMTTTRLVAVEVLVVSSSSIEF
jgi:hypothetical protein